MSLKHQLESNFTAHKNWALRRQLGIPNNRRLWVLHGRTPLRRCSGPQS